LWNSGGLSAIHIENLPFILRTSQSKGQKSDVLLSNYATNATTLAVGSLGHGRKYSLIPDSCKFLLNVEESRNY
jgi:hypothetical protein